jgi:hypothetical protein
MPGRAQIRQRSGKEVDNRSGKRVFAGFGLEWSCELRVEGDEPSWSAGHRQQRARIINWAFLKIDFCQTIRAFFVASPRGELEFAATAEQHYQTKLRI